MKLKRIALAAGAAGVVFGASAFADPLAGPNDDSAVRKVVADATAAWLACDVAAAAKFSVAGRSGYYPDSAELQIDTPEMQQKEVEFCKNGGKNEMTYKLNGVEIVGDAAIAHGSGHYKRTEPGGAVSVDSDFTFTDVLVRTADGWRYRHSHVGMVMPMDGSEKIVGEKT